MAVVTALLVQLAAFIDADLALETQKKPLAKHMIMIFINIFISQLLELDDTLNNLYLSSSISETPMTEP